MRYRNLVVLDQFQVSAYGQVPTNSKGHYCLHQVKDNIET